MNVLVLGSKGQLGRELCRIFADGAEVMGADLPELDITDRDNVAALVAGASPGLVINAAAYTDVEGYNLADRRLARIGNPEFFNDGVN